MDRGWVRRGRRENGQAFAEMVVCLIPILFVFIGIFLVGVFGLENLQNTIHARVAADGSAVTGSLYTPEETQKSSLSKVSSQFIRDIDFGQDGVPFTSDDSINTSSGNFQTSYSMSQALDTAEYTISGGSDPHHIVGVKAVDLAEKKYLQEKVFYGFQAESDSSDMKRVFLDSADLFGIRSVTSDGLENYGFSAASSLYRMFADSSVVLSGTAYMPSRKDGSFNEEEKEEESTDGQ